MKEAKEHLIQDLVQIIIENPEVQAYALAETQKRMEQLGMEPFNGEDESIYYDLMAMYQLEILAQVGSRLVNN